MQKVQPSRATTDVLTSIRRIVQEERAAFETVEAPLPPKEALRLGDSDLPETPPCKLLLTDDFRVRAPAMTRIPHPIAADARENYAEDSDMGVAVQTDSPAPALTTALRDAVRNSVRAALDTDDTVATDSPLAAPGQAPKEELLLSGDIEVDTHALRELVTRIVYDELRGALGEQISRRVRKLVRAEINRTLQIHALD